MKYTLVVVMIYPVQGFNAKFRGVMTLIFGTNLRQVLHNSKFMSGCKIICLKIVDASIHKKIRSMSTKILEFTSYVLVIYNYNLNISDYLQLWYKYQAHSMSANECLNGHA